MNHATDKMQAWLAGELTGAEASAVEKHLEVCPDCARAATQDRQLWEMLGRVADDLPVATGSVWPAVREKTFNRSGAGSWFFGTGRLVQSSLATGALIAGLVLGVFLPGGGGGQVGGVAEAVTSSEDQPETIWLSGTSWGNGTTEFETAWVSAGLDEANTEPADERVR